MNPQHHLDQATLVNYAAGALSSSMSVVVATHLMGCAVCRSQLAVAEGIGGALMAAQRPDATEPPTRLREAMLAKLDRPTAPKARSVAIKGTSEAPPVDPDSLPRPLQRYFGCSWNMLRWRWVAPGVHMIRADRPREDTLILLKIAPGKSMPMHSHGGSELTQILQGSYDDKLGHFAPGDVADLDSDVEHQPITAPGVPCVCVAALDAPLRFQGWLARKLQPLVGL